ncbi:hypothetical protein ES703_110845 [subsurface metagenome]
MATLVEGNNELDVALEPIVLEIDLQVNALYDDCQRSNLGLTLRNFMNTVGYWQDPTEILPDGWHSLGCGLRFIDADIAQGEIIKTAYLSFCPEGFNKHRVVNSKIRGQASGNALSFTTMEDFDARPRTDAFVYWDDIEPFVWVGQVWHNSPEIKPVIQEIIDLPSWRRRNALVLFWDDFDNRSTPAFHTTREAQSYYNHPELAPKLHIELLR